jgi:hypothetical protein
VNPTVSRAALVASRSGAWFEKMDYGPALGSTIGVGKDVVLKGQAVRLGMDESRTMVYDTEMMSFNAAKDGFLKINGTAWDGRHGGFPSTTHQNVVSKLGPGWAKNGSFDDPRAIPYGPLPKDWVKYRGQYRHGSDVVLHYNVGKTEVFEKPAYEKHNGVAAYTRTFNIAKAEADMTMMVLRGSGAKLIGEGAAEKKEEAPKHKPGLNVITHRHEGDWNGMAMGAPSSKDSANGKPVTFATGGKFGGPHGQSGAKGNTVPRITDGQQAGNNDDVGKCVWFDGKGAQFTIDLGAVTDVQRINVYSWHTSDRAPQRYTLAGAGADKTFKDITKVDTKKLGDGGKHGTSIFKGEGTLGKFQYLRWTTPGMKHGAFFTEIDVFDAAAKLPAVKNPGHAGPSNVTVAAVGSGIKLRRAGDDILADIKKGASVNGKIIMAVDGQLDLVVQSWPERKDLSQFTKGGPIQWPDVIKVQGTIGKESPYATDQIPLPENNPWGSKIRFSGFDFFADGKRAAICTWNGDVWVVSGIDKDLQNLSWKRYATGLFETLGLKIVNDLVYVTGKDQITRLHDLNNDGEADYYENFNNDIMITKNFHEFTFDLQTDKQGNFYFAKGAPVRSGGRNFEYTHKHHGVIFKVSKDGSTSEVHSEGLRAPGGIGVGPNGEVTSGENEGTYVPACRVTWCKKSSFAGVIMEGNGRKFEQGYDNPICWMPMTIDNSGGGQVWVDNDQWGPFNGDLLHFSYGRSSIYQVMMQEVGDQMQGGVVKLPIKLASSAMRGRFNPVDKQLYVSGFRGWQTNAAKESALQRVRYTGAPIALPQDMKVTKKGIEITFTQKLDKELAEDTESYSIKIWQYVWGPQYGSGHFSIDNPNPEALATALKKETGAGGTRGGSVRQAKFKGDPVEVKSAKLSADGKTVILEIPTIKPAMQMRIDLDLETTDGQEIITNIHNSIWELGE